MIAVPSLTRTLCRASTNAPGRNAAVNLCDGSTENAVLSNERDVRNAGRNDSGGEEERSGTIVVSSDGDDGVDDVDDDESVVLVSGADVDEDEESACTSASACFCNNNKSATCILQTTELNI